MFVLLCGYTIYMCVCAFVYNHKLFHNHTSFLHKCRWQFFRNFLFAFYFQLKYSDNGQLRDIHWMVAALTSDLTGWMEWMDICEMLLPCLLWAYSNCDNKYWFPYKKLHLWFIWRSLFYLRQLVSTCFFVVLWENWVRWLSFVTLAPDRTALWC